ncbi:uncharacterized protein LOC128870179 [Anastrepha ludens]|uniref:uncharacterized protein LOC128870179 n=1 Tax=Anastrepha ludens TaxID=28586 RepID=UPI0023AE7578|nr:uncharacterized protein LOC128870179 [Anastrepha ludens]
MTKRRKCGTPSEDEILERSQETVDGKDAAEKARCQKVVDEYPAFQTTQKAETVKRNRSQDEGGKTAKKMPHTALTLKPAKLAFNEVARDHLQTALVDELTNRGKPALKKWPEIEARLSRIVVDHGMASSTGQVPGFDSMEVVRGYRVIKCDGQLSVDLLQNTVSKIQSDWEGLRLKLIPASEILRRPKARIRLAANPILTSTQLPCSNG